MARKTRYISITAEKSGFTGFFRKIKLGKKDYDFSGLNTLRQILSNEKARLLNVIKIKKPGSIYELSKILGRDYKSVREDVKLLERFGFIDLVAEKKGKREKLKPIPAVDSISIEVSI